MSHFPGFSHRRSDGGAPAASADRSIACETPADGEPSTLVHLVPNADQQACGVCDYAMNITDKICELSEEVDSDVLPLELVFPERPHEISPEKFWSDLLDHVGVPETCSSAPTFVLHYSGYGFSRDGAPLWLANSIRDRSAGNSNPKVVTFFHELYATAWPWRRTFWHSRRQQRVAIQIARHSDAVITNREASARWLERFALTDGRRVEHLPVPSNMGEPDSVDEFSKRGDQGVLFGRPIYKAPFTKGKGARRTIRLCRHLGITRLLDLGTTADWDFELFEDAGVEVNTLGRLPAEEIVSQLLRAKVAFFDYFPGHLEKSGILAAFASCGVPVIASARTSSQLFQLIGLENPIEFSSQLCELDQRFVISSLNEISGAMRRWSLGHGVKQHAELILSACETLYARH